MKRDVPALSGAVVEQWFSSIIKRGVRPDSETCRNLAFVLSKNFYPENDGLTTAADLEAERVERVSQKQKQDSEKRLRESIRIIRSAIESAVNDTELDPRAAAAFEPLQLALTAAEPFLIRSPRRPGRPSKMEGRPWALVAIVVGSTVQSILVDIGQTSAGITRNSHTAQFTEALLKYWGFAAEREAIAVLLSQALNDQKTGRQSPPPINSSTDLPNGQSRIPRHRRKQEGDT